VNDLDDARASEVARALEAEGGRARSLAGDAGDPVHAQALVAAAVRAFSRLDLAVANAGFSLFSDFFETAPADFDRVTGLNLRGSYFLAQAAARQMRAQGEGGRILLLSSVCGHLAIRSMAAYSMSKAGIEMLVKGLVPELSPHRITINAIAPGATITPRTLAMDPATRRPGGRRSRSGGSPRSRTSRPPPSSCSLRRPGTSRASPSWSTEAGPPWGTRRSRPP
jgi:3-oxoacyl-[acyl-carrier protein] reductase